MYHTRWQGLLNLWVVMGTTTVGYGSNHHGGCYRGPRVGGLEGPSFATAMSAGQMQSLSARRNIAVSIGCPGR